MTHITVDCRCRAVSQHVDTGRVVLEATHMDAAIVDDVDVLVNSPPDTYI